MDYSFLKNATKLSDLTDSQQDDIKKEQSSITKRFCAYTIFEIILLCAIISTGIVFVFKLSDSSASVSIYAVLIYIFLAFVVSPIYFFGKLGVKLRGRALESLYAYTKLSILEIEAKDKLDKDDTAYRVSLEKDMEFYKKEMRKKPLFTFSCYNYQF